MRVRFLNLLLLLAPLLVLSNAASAITPVFTTTYSFEFVGTGYYVHYDASGAITINNLTDSLSNAGLGHDITNITGTLSTPALGLDGTITGPVYTSVFAPAAPDNYLYLTAPYVDFNGLAFQTSDGSIFRIFAFTVDPMQIYDNAFGNGNGFILPQDVTGNFSLTSGVPEPSTWAMMLLGFVGIGAMTYRRRKSALA